MKNLLSIIFLSFIMVSTFSCSSDNGNDTLSISQTVILPENVTNNEVDAIIEEGIRNGMNTLIVENTTNLTTLDLNELNSLDTLKIVGNEKLDNITFSNLESVVGELSIVDNDALTAANFSKLSQVKTLNFSSNDFIEDISFPKLTSITKKLTIQTCDNLETISLDEITSSDTGEISISRNLKVNSITMPNLTTIGELGIGRNESIPSLSFPNLTEVKIVFNINDNPNLTSISLPLLTSVAITRITNGEDDGGLYINDNDALENIDVSNLEFSWIVSIINNQLLNAIHLPKLTKAPSWINIQSNTEITSLNLSSLNEFNVLDAKYISTSVIDELLNRLVTINPPISEKRISIIGGNASAQALEHAETLRTNNNTVTIRE